MTNDDKTLKPVAGYYWYNAAERIIVISGLLDIEAKRSTWVLITEEEKQLIEAEWITEEERGET